MAEIKLKADVPSRWRHSERDKKNNIASDVSEVKKDETARHTV